MKYSFFALALVISSCSHFSRCGYPSNSQAVFSADKGCQVRIRQVTVGTELQVPESLKGPELSNFQLDWIDPVVREGRIHLGHFVLVPGPEVAEQ